MMLRYLSLTASVLAALTLAACGNDDEAEPEADAAAEPVDAAAEPVEAVADAPAAAPVFGTESDRAFADDIWTALAAANLVGDRVVHAPFYAGGEPHGFVLETIFADITVAGNDARVVVKRNYGPAGIAIQDVADNPEEYLAAITVMYQRPGFNAETNDWFWVKWLPDGTLDLAGETPMAGNVGGCIGCHVNAPGEDWIFVTDRPM